MRALVLCLLLAACAAPVSEDGYADTLEAERIWLSIGATPLYGCPRLRETVVSLADFEHIGGRPHCSTTQGTCAWAFTLGAETDAPEMFRTNVDMPGHTAEDEVIHETFHMFMACMTGDADREHVQTWIWQQAHAEE